MSSAAASILSDFQYLTGWAPEWPALTWRLSPLWVGVRLDNREILSKLYYSIIHETLTGSEFLCCPLQESFETAGTN